LVFKSQVDFVKHDVINHIVIRTSSEWQMIKNTWQNTDIAIVADPRRVLNCQSFLVWILAILHFILESHLIF
jgi:hypothetical protein